MSDEKPYTQRTRITGCRFLSSITMGGEMTSAFLGPKGNAYSIQPATVDAEGKAVPIEKGQQSIGLLVRRRVDDRARGLRYIDQELVPWANVRGVQYGE